MAFLVNGARRLIWGAPAPAAQPPARPLQEERERLRQEREALAAERGRLERERPIQNQQVEDSSNAVLYSISLVALAAIEAATLNFSPEHLGMATFGAFTIYAAQPIIQHILPLATLGLFETGVARCLPSNYSGIAALAATSLYGMRSQVSNILKGGTPYQSLLGRIKEAFIASATTLSTKIMIEKIHSLLPTTTLPAPALEETTQTSVFKSVTDATSQVLNQVLPENISAFPLSASTALTVTLMTLGLANALPNIVMGDSSFGRPYASASKRMLQTMVIAATTLAAFSLAKPYLPEEISPVAVTAAKMAASCGLSVIRTGLNTLFTSVSYLFSAGSTLYKFCT